MTEQEKREIEEIENIAEYQLFDLAGDSNDVAKALYKAGYRKLTEGAVVLTEEKIAQLRKGIDTFDYTDLVMGKEREAEQQFDIHFLYALNMVRKETAKDYHDKMAQEIESHNFEISTDYEYMNICNKEILKEYGVEVEE